MKYRHMIVRWMLSGNREVSTAKHQAKPGELCRRGKKKDGRRQSRPGHQDNPNNPTTASTKQGSEALTETEATMQSRPGLLHTGCLQSLGFLRDS